jgi:DNA gyrase inhibitor GyrI
VSVPSDFEPVGPFGKLELPGGTWACVDCDGTVDRHFASWNTFAFQWLPDSNWTMSYPLVAQEYHLPGDLLYHPVQLIKAVMGRFSATELIPVTPGPVGALRPI